MFTTLKRLVYRTIIAWLRRRGYSEYFAPIVVRSIREDLFDRNLATYREKYWAFSHGFRPKSMLECGINPDNHTLYVPDFPYFRAHPMNGRFRTWLDDKLTLRYVLSAFPHYLPKYYYLMSSGQVSALPDAPEGTIPSDNGFNGVLSLLQETKMLALKPLAGSSGQGFHRISLLDGKFAIDNDVCDVDHLRSWLSRLKQTYLATEYLRCHPELERVFPSVPPVLRVSVAKTPKYGARVLGAFIEFATSRSGMVSNPTAGGVFVGVHLDTGAYFSPRMYDNGHLVELDRHPDTGVGFDGGVPDWERIKNEAIQIAEYLSPIRWIGYDFIIQEKGFKILELNSHQAIGRLQMFYPLRATDFGKELFGALDARNLAR